MPSHKLKLGVVVRNLLYENQNINILHIIIKTQVIVLDLRHILL